MIEIIYVATPDRLTQLAQSIKTLYRSGTPFDQLTIYWNAATNPPLTSPDQRLSWVKAPSLFPAYPYANKCYLCRSTADVVVFLDTDTFIQRNLDSFWTAGHPDVQARVGTAYSHPGWNHEVWRASFKPGDTLMPMFNTGFLVFQNQFQRKLGPCWRHFIQDYLSGRLNPPIDGLRMTDQFAFSLALGKLNPSWVPMTPNDHHFGWTGETPSHPKVIHTGAENYPIPSHPPA